MKYLPYPAQTILIRLGCVVGLLGMLTAVPCSAQYALTETGINLGLGGRVPLQSGRLATAFDGQANFYYTHYRCGKRDGYWLEGGVYSYTFQEQSGTGTSLVMPGQTGATQLSSFGGALAAYYKVRKHNYHRNREWALLVGPRLLYSAVTRAYPATGALTLKDDDYHKVNPFQPALHLGVVYRQPNPMGSSIFLEAGMEASPVPLIKAGNAKFASLMLFFKAGLRLYKD